MVFFHCEMDISLCYIYLNYLPRRIAVFARDRILAEAVTVAPRVFVAALLRSFAYDERSVVHRVPCLKCLRIALGCAEWRKGLGRVGITLGGGPCVGSHPKGNAPPDRFQARCGSNLGRIIPRTFLS